MSFPFLQLPFDVQLIILNQIDLGSLNRFRLSGRQINAFVLENRRSIKLGPTVRLADVLGVSTAPSPESSKLIIMRQGKTTNFDEHWDSVVFYRMKIEKIILYHVTHSATVEKFHNHIIKYGWNVDYICAECSQITTTMLNTLKPKKLSIGRGSIAEENVLQHVPSLELFHSDVPVNFDPEWVGFVKIPHLEMNNQKELPVEVIRMAVQEWRANERHILCWIFSLSKKEDSVDPCEILPGVKSEYVWKRRANGGRNRFGRDIRSIMGSIDYVHVITNVTKSDRLLVVFFETGLALYNSKYENGRSLLRDLNRT